MSEFSVRIFRAWEHPTHLPLRVAFEALRTAIAEYGFTLHGPKGVPYVFSATTEGDYVKVKALRQAACRKRGK